MPSLTAPDIGTRAHAVRDRLRVAAERAGRDPADVRIVAVSKTFPIEACRAALDAGLGILGENRVQEALPKIAALPAAEWHLVGHLQSNKVRRAVAGFAAIHSVDSLGLLRQIERAAHDTGKRPRLLLQVNVTGEGSKFGFEPEAVAGADLLRAIRELDRARLVGLMTIGAHHRDPGRGFARLRAIREALEDALGVSLPELSMGMSADAEVAVAEGATLVRIGTALFGPRLA